MNTSNEPRGKRPPGNSILLADDDASVREMIGRALVAEGYSVFLAANGTEALAITAVNPIDVVVLDLTLPDRDGWDTYEQLVARDPLCKVIVITGRPMQQMQAVEAGVDALIEKPVNPSSLLYCLRSLLQETSTQRSNRLISAYVSRRQAGATQRICS